jgi:hypothetical protein
MYFDNSGGGGGGGDDDQPYQVGTGQGFYLNFDSSQPIEQELMMQCQIEAQLLSPSERQRTDSLFSCSQSNVSKSSMPSPYQADAQPCVSAAPTTPHGYPQRPVNMTRVGSQFSATSGQQQHRSQHRPSFGNGSRSGAVDMSRSSTQYSAGSPGYTQQQRFSPPQPHLSQPHLDLTDRTASNSGYFNEVAASEQDTQYNHNATTVPNPMDLWYDIALQDIQTSGALGGNDTGMSYSPVHVSRQHAQACTSNE